MRINKDCDKQLWTKLTKEYDELLKEIIPLRQQSYLLRTAPRAISLKANFDKGTWLFEMESECVASDGTYALVRLNPPNLLDWSDK